MSTRLNFRFLADLYNIVYNKRYCTKNPALTGGIFETLCSRAYAVACLFILVLIFLAPFFALWKMAFGSQKNVGTRYIVRIADTMRPPTEAIPIGWVIAAT